jgi:hypothetical protein
MVETMESGVFHRSEDGRIPAELNQAFACPESAPIEFGVNLVKSRSS